MRAAIASCGAMLACVNGEPAARMLTAPSATLATGHQATDVALAIDPDNGHLLMSWVGGRDSTWFIYLVRSRDGGATWETPVQAHEVAGDVVPHGEASPRLMAAPNGLVAVAWPDGFKVAGRTYGANHMRFTRSTDGGRSWEPTRTLNDDTLLAPSGHTFHGAVWAGDSTLLVAWLNERATRDAKAIQERGAGADEGDAALHLARSDDLGLSWRANQVLWTDVCPCCRVSLAREPGGGVVAAWRQHFGKDVRDIAAASLSVMPLEPVRVFADQWVFPGCPHTGPALATGAGITHVSWYTGKPGATGVRYARGGDGLTFERAVFLTRGAVPPAHTAVAALDDGGAVVAYDRDDDGARRITVVVIDGDGLPVLREVIPGSDGADHPSAVPVSGGAVVAWAQQGSEAGNPWRLGVVFVAVPRDNTSLKE